MYSPRYQITNSVLKSIGAIEAAKEVIEAAPLIPDYERDFQTEAVFRQIYHGTHIEGNELTLTQTKQILEGQSIFARDRDIQEVINYRNVVKLLDSMATATYPYRVDDLLDIHSATVNRIVPEDKVGAIRKTQVVIKDQPSVPVMTKKAYLSFTLPPSTTLSPRKKQVAFAKPKLSSAKKELEKSFLNPLLLLKYLTLSMIFLFGSIVRQLAKSTLFSALVSPIMFLLLFTLLLKVMAVLSVHFLSLLCSKKAITSDVSSLLKNILTKTWQLTMPPLPVSIASIQILPTAT